MVHALEGRKHQRRPSLLDVSLESFPDRVDVWTKTFLYSGTVGRTQIRRRKIEGAVEYLDSRSLREMDPKAGEEQGNQISANIPDERKGHKNLRSCYQVKNTDFSVVIKF